MSRARPKKFEFGGVCKFLKGAYWQVIRHYKTPSGAALIAIPLPDWTDPNVEPPESVVNALIPQFRQMEEDAGLPSSA